MKKTIVWLLLVATLVAALPAGMISSAEEPAAKNRLSEASVWSGTVYQVASEDALYTFDGEGTESNPYLLKNAEDVAKLAANVNYANADTSYNGKYFKLMCDLNLDNKEWVGIGFGGADSNRFEGNFDGDGHVVYNFNLKPAQYNGFFGYVGNGAVIRNLGLANGEIWLGAARSSSLIAFSKKNVTVSNCFSRVRVNFSGNGHIGGMIGVMMNDAEAVRVIENCYATGNVTVTNASKNYAVGGIAGSISDGSTSMNNCYYTGTVNVTATTNGLEYTDLYQHSVGGLVGSNPWPGTYAYANCGVGGKIVYSNKNAEYPLNLGSVVGYIYKDATVNFGDGNVTAIPDVANVIGGGYATQPTNVEAKESVSIPYAEGSRYFIGAVATDIANKLPGGEPTDSDEEEERKELELSEVPTEKTLYAPTDSAEQARYAAASKWDGTVYSVLSEEEIYTFEGSGTKKDPYLLKSAEDLAKFAANVRFSNEGTSYLEKYFRLTCDVDFQNYGWWGIGGCKTAIAWDDNTMFAGHFDGDNHVIYNFNLADRDEAGKQLLFNGLFGYAGYGSIRNIGIANGDVWLGAASRTAALIGASRYDIVVSNCFNRANMTFLYDGAGEVRVGGLMGAVMNNNYTERTIENCYNSGNITVYAKGVSEHAVGGLVGYLSDGTGNYFKNCVNVGGIAVYADHGKLGPTDTFKVGIGSLVGSLAWKGAYAFENCAAGGSIRYTNATSGNTVLFGIFAGYARDTATVSMGSGNTYSVTVEGDVLIGGWDNGKFTAAEKKDTVSVTLADLYFMSAGKTDPTPVDPVDPVDPNKPNPPQQGESGESGESKTDEKPTDSKPEGGEQTTASAEKPAKAGCASSIRYGWIVTVPMAAIAVWVSLKRRKSDSIR